MAEKSSTDTEYDKYRINDIYGEPPDWTPEQIRFAVDHKKLAPMHPILEGLDEEKHPECKICFVNFPRFALNETICCHELLCSTCIVNLHPAPGSVEHRNCPFCDSEVFSTRVLPETRVIAPASPLKAPSHAELPSPAKPDRGEGFRADTIPGEAPEVNVKAPAAMPREIVAPAGLVDVIRSMADADGRVELPGGLDTLMTLMTLRQSMLEAGVAPDDIDMEELFHSITD